MVLKRKNTNIHLQYCHGSEVCGRAELPEKKKMEEHAFSGAAAVVWVDLISSGCLQQEKPR